MQISDGGKFDRLMRLIVVLLFSTTVFCVSSCLVKDPQNIKYNALMGFINYKSKESALACLMGASSSEKIKGLFINEKVYVNLHVPKSQH